MKNLINVNSWSLGHLDVETNASDYYYVKLVRKLYDIIHFSEVGRDEGRVLCERFAMAATYYFEDVVSGIGVWQTFTSKHKELYGKYLPFYDLDEEEYYQDEINFEDICFLMWMILQKEKKGTFLNPENPYLVKMASMIYNVLDAEFEKAPINAEMLERLKDQSYFQDFYSVKFMLTRLNDDLYLLKPFATGRTAKVEDEVKGVLGDSLDDSSFAYAVESIMACCEKTGPLALYTKDWLAAMLTHWGMTEESERLATIESLKYAVYLLKRYDSEAICLEDIKGEEYVISRDSFKELPDSTLLDNKSFIGSLVKYDGEWLVNGVSSWSLGTKLFDAYKEKMTMTGGDSVVYNKIMEINENHPMLYFKDYEEMLGWFDRHIGLDERFTLPEQMKKQRFFAIYVDRVRDMAMLPDGALVIKDDHNPYYSRKTAEEQGINYIVSAETTSKEMLHYLIEHNMLPDACINSIKGMERGRQLVQENMDFIARFMRGDDY
ncbi:DUF3843 family protein [Bacteroides faecium]|uniref:DUF3843 family protein n=1 Tax=Bacteroides faecium TaxID=2715212 RepID=A0A6H0KIQ2_9BACE|nr:DUF3843 family protein [Bacteroides faecium]QIU92911.1 DUF3843 family protein [Bacteroides faecium]